MNRYILLYKEKTQPDSLLFKMEKKSENIVIIIHLLNDNYWTSGMYQGLF